MRDDLPVPVWQIVAVILVALIMITPLAVRL